MPTPVLTAALAGFSASITFPREIKNGGAAASVFSSAGRNQVRSFLTLLRLARISSICSKRTGLTMWWSKPASNAS